MKSQPLIIVLLLELWFWSSTFGVLVLHSAAIILYATVACSTTYHIVESSAGMLIAVCSDRHNDIPDCGVYCC